MGESIAQRGEEAEERRLSRGIRKGNLVVVSSMEEMRFLRPLHSTQAATTGANTGVAGVSEFEELNPRMRNQKCGGGREGRRNCYLWILISQSVFEFHFFLCSIPPVDHSPTLSLCTSPLFLLRETWQDLFESFAEKSIAPPASEEREGEGEGREG
jgi:hypothetical protein